MRLKNGFPGAAQGAWADRKVALERAAQRRFGLIADIGRNLAQRIGSMYDAVSRDPEPNLLRKAHGGTPHMRRKARTNVARETAAIEASSSRLHSRAGSSSTATAGRC